MLAPNASSGSYEDVRARVLRYLAAAHLDDHVFEMVQAAFGSALAEEGLVLSAAEKRRLLADVLTSILQEMDRRLGR